MILALRLVILCQRMGAKTILALRLLLVNAKVWDSGPHKLGLLFEQLITTQEPSLLCILSLNKNGHLFCPKAWDIIYKHLQPEIHLSFCW